MKPKWIRRIIGGLSFTTALFVFQACYGTPQATGSDVLVHGKVTSQNTNQPISGIKVSIDGEDQWCTTNQDGSYFLYTEKKPAINIRFEDENEVHNSKDTVISQVNDEVVVDVYLAAR